MDMNTGIKSNRRTFLLGTGTLIASSALPLAATAHATLEKTTLEGIVVYRESDARSAAYAAVLAETGMKLLPLAVDPVRQWRDQVSASLQQNSLPMYGLTDWADFQLMRELNVELRRSQVIETRHASINRDDVEWASDLAMKHVENIKAQGASSAKGFDEGIHHGNLFSWNLGPVNTI